MKWALLSSLDVTYPICFLFLTCCMYVVTVASFPGLDVESMYTIEEVLRWYQLLLLLEPRYTVWMSLYLVIQIPQWEGHLRDH